MGISYWKRTFTATIITFSQLIAANNYTTYAETALDVLQQWYNNSTGLWEIATWYHSPQPVTTISDLAAVDSNVVSQVKEILANTHSVAPHHNPDNSSANWFENYYDNEGWWALAWIAAYDLTEETNYLQTAMDLFDNMVGGWQTQYCGGGIWWTKNGKPRTELNSIANGLFLSVGAHLANRVTSSIKTSNGITHNKQYYVQWALEEWAWIQKVKFIGSNNLVNGRLDLNDSCSVPYVGYWTYTQGVIMGGLIELNKASPNETYLPLAHNIATASLAKFSDSKGVIHDHCEPDCNVNDQMFKGVFMRNLQYLQSVAPQAAYVTAIKENAYSVWTKARNSMNQIGQDWSGPFNGTANAVAQAAGMDALVAGIVYA